MPLNSHDECQNAHSVVVLTDEGTGNLPYRPLSIVGHVEVPSLMKSETCLTSEPKLQPHTNLKVDEVSNYACILNINAEKGKAEIPKSIEESVTNSKPDDSFARVFQREICLQMGGKFTQLLMNHSPELPKFITRADKFFAERAHDTPSNRYRKYKRSTSFNSRRVVLLFSVLSSIGTIILIYLTLRVKQMADGYGNYGNL